ncbi:hypothetical protein [Pengzhenrongella sp.]|jgi:antitoxin (DNA-binding transcriptional repressor) of toxin-antitoxin stability system|uniref:type II toxin-antitoxin system Phd/YefM family antitoxin n=1 Tax=Pengzhenrongella sp. TaxID=2888820 RepID=UPI002F94EB73
MTVESHRRVSMLEAEAHLSTLICAVENGETVDITRRGRPVVTVSPLFAPKRSIDLAWLKVVADSMPLRAAAAGDLARELREASRY